MNKHNISYLIAGLLLLGGATAVSFQSEMGKSLQTSSVLTDTVTVNTSNLTTTKSALTDSNSGLVDTSVKSVSSTEVAPTQARVSDLETWACDDSMYLMQRRNGVSNMFEVGEDASFTPVGVISQYSHNSTAFNANDGYMYGIAGQSIIRIGQNGEEVVGSVNVSGPYSGAFLADGTYVANNGSTMYHIDIDTLKVLKSFSVGGSFADIARNPVDGLFYGFDNSSKRMAVVNPQTGAVDFISESQKSVITQAGAAFFSSAGELFLYGKNPQSKNQDTLFRVNASDGAVTQIAVGDEVTGSDGASCVKGKDADPDDEHEADPDVEICFEEQEITIKQSELAAYLKNGAIQGDCPEPEKKVEICFIENGDVINGETREIFESELEEQLAQGHTEGPCEPVLEVCDITDPFNALTIMVLASESENEVYLQGECQMVNICQNAGTQQQTEATVPEQIANEYGVLGACPGFVEVCDITDPLNAVTKTVVETEANGSNLIKGVCDLVDVCVNAGEVTQSSVTVPKALAGKYGQEGNCPDLIDVCTYEGETITVTEEASKPFIEAGGALGECNDVVDVCLYDLPNNTGIDIQIPYLQIAEYKAQGYLVGKCIITEPVVRPPGQGAPTVNSIKVCRDNNRGSQQCTAAFPVQPSIGAKDPTVTQYEECMETRKDSDYCLNQWARNNSYSTCDDDSQCSGDIGTAPEAPEYEFTAGCIRMNEEYYCPHAKEGACIDIDGQKHCQSKDQQCMMERVSFRVINWPGGVDYLVKRNNTQNVFTKLCVYDPVQEAALDVAAEPSSHATSYTPTVQMCAKSGEIFEGPAMMLRTGNCVVTYPHDQASPYFNTYENCVKRGNDKETCVQQWAAGTGSFCTQNSDC